MICDPFGKKKTQRQSVKPVSRKRVITLTVPYAAFEAAPYCRSQAEPHHREGIRPRLQGDVKGRISEVKAGFSNAKDGMDLMRENSRGSNLWVIQDIQNKAPTTREFFHS